jgi:hypothetical protein
VDFPDFSSIAPSTGVILLVLLLIWAAVMVILYWGFSSGTTSLREKVKMKVVQDDEPIRDDH